VPKVRRLEKLPKRKVTIDDLLELDTIRGILAELDTEKADIDELVVVYSKRDSSHFSLITNGLPESRLIYMLEAIKYTLLGDK